MTKVDEIRSRLDRLTDLFRWAGFTFTPGKVTDVYGEVYRDLDAVRDYVVRGQGDPMLVVRGYVIAHHERADMRGS